MRVIGYYRSHLGTHLCLTDSDQHLINRCFTDPADVFLVVKSTDGGPPAAGFFFWGGGVVFGAFSFFEFPFDAQALAPRQLAPKEPDDRNGPSASQGTDAQTVIAESEASGVFAPTSTTPAEPEESFVWTFPGCPIRVELNPQVVERLRNEVLQDTGNETGGLLLGKGGGGTVAIMEYEPLRRAHGDNNQFVLSAAEIASLQARLSADGDTSELKVVGYYRSHLSENLCLTDNDLHLINTCFPDPSHVFLVIKPVSSDTAKAGFFFWDCGAVFGAFSFLEFPFHAWALAPWRHVEQAPPEELPAEVPLIGIPPSTAASAAPTPGQRRRRLKGRPLALAIGLLLAALGLLPLLRVSTKRNPALGLQIAPYGNGFQVSWNRAAAFVSTAKSGRLFIRDGSQKEQSVILDASMLKSGTVVYSLQPTGESVKFRFEVSGRDGSTAMESVIAIVHIGGRATNDLALQQGEEPETAAARIPAPALARQVRAPLLRKQNQSRRVLFVAPTPIKGPAYPGSGGTIPAPPSIAPTWERSALPAALQTQLREPGRMDASAAKLEYVAPVLISQVAPVLPTTLQRLSLDGVRIRLQVQINEFGKVVGGKSLSAGNSLVNYLSTIALESAKQWRFSPGRLGNKNIPSETVVEFQFAKTQTR